MSRDFCDSGDGYRTGSGVWVVVKRSKDPGIGEGDMVGRWGARGMRRVYEIMCPNNLAQ
jgi:hypothetical protein